MQAIRQFTERAFVAGGQYNEELTGDVLDSIHLQQDGIITTTTTVVRDDAAARMLGTPEVVQSSQPLIRMAGADWRHISALASGGYDNNAEPATTGAAAYTQFGLPLGGIMPGAAIDASAEKVFIRGQFGAFADYSGGVPITAYAATLRPTGTTIERERIAGGYRRPNFWQFTVDIGTVSTDIQHLLRFEEDVIVAGIFLRVFDASDVGRDDGLVKRIRADVNTHDSGGTRELIRMTWGQVRHHSQHRANFNQEDFNRAVGTGLLPTIDPRNNLARGAFAFRRNDSLTLHIDTASTVESLFTNTGALTGDILFCTVLGFTMVQPNAGQVGSGTSANVGLARPQIAPTTQRRLPGRRAFDPRRPRG